MSSPYGVAFPTSGGSSPYIASSYPAASPVQQQVPIQPGSITYTTTTLPDGRIQYNEFRAETRSYQTPQGIVHGIQWVPVNVSYEVPLNAHPAGPDFYASWSRYGNDKDAQRMIKEWQRDQEKRAKKEEKESAKKMKEWERERREREKAEEKELRKMQERDMLRGGRPRRLSDVGYAADYQTYTISSSSRARSRSRVRGDDVGDEDITRRMAELAMGMGETESRRERERERRNSNVGRPRRLSINEQSRVYSQGEYERTRKTSGTPYPTASYASGVYGAPPSPRRASYSNRASPYMGGAALPVAGYGGPVYPPGHIYAGKPIPSGQADTLGTFPGSYHAASPRRSSMQLESPSGFTRRPSLAAAYTYFDPILITPDLNALYAQLPPMPAALVPHDVWPEDWDRCFDDISLAWLGKLPSVKTGTKKPQRQVAQLIDVWNASFFVLRGVELVLFYGRQRRSGPQAGRHDSRLGIEGSSDEESDTISSVSSESDGEGRYGFYGGGAHARHGGNPWLTESKQARRARRERRRQEKQKQKRREREKERGSGYSIYLVCTGDGHAARAYHG